MTRLGQGVATSPLEIMTLAFAVSTALTYILLIDKPKDVQTSVVIPATRHPTPQEITRLGVAGPTSLHYFRRSVWIPNNAVHASSRNAPHIDLLYGAAASVITFGAIHCIGWNFVYPTEIEKLLWRVSSIVTATAFPAFPVVPTIANAIMQRFDKSFISTPPFFYTRYLTTQNTIIYSIFFAARLFTIVEVIRSLAFLPADAFTTTWSNNIPHIG